MMEMNMSEWLRMADELGIDYKLDLERPGLFVKNNGIKSEADTFELFGIENCEEKDLTYSISFEKSSSYSNTDQSDHFFELIPNEVVTAKSSKKTFEEVKLDHLVFSTSDNIYAA